MKESVTYQAILEEGRIVGEQKGLVEGERKGRVDGEYRAIRRVGTKRFGVPSATTDALLRAIDSLDRLESLLDRITEVESWEELLADA